MPDKNQLELAYFAGFFDGEGCVAIYKAKNVVVIANTDVRPLQRAQELWGGHLDCQERGEKGIQDLWRWQLYGHNSREFLEDILPFSRLKKEQIEVYLNALDHMPNGRGQRRPAGSSEVIEAAAVRLRLLKRGAA